MQVLLLYDSTGKRKKQVLSLSQKALLLSCGIATFCHSFYMIVGNVIMCTNDADNYYHGADAWVINSGTVSLSCKLL